MFGKVLGVAWRTPGYKIKKKEIMREKAGRRAEEFEKRLERGEGNRIAGKRRKIES